MQYCSWKSIYLSSLLQNQRRRKAQTMTIVVKKLRIKRVQQEVCPTGVELGCIRVQCWTIRPGNRFFVAAGEATSAQSLASTVLRKYKRLSVNGCKCKNPTSSAKGIFNFITKWEECIKLQGCVDNDGVNDARLTCNGFSFKVQGLPIQQPLQMTLQRALGKYFSTDYFRHNTLSGPG